MKPVLVVLPHPDDEVFFCASVRHLIGTGASLLLVYATPGGLAPRGQRVRSLGRSLTRLGVEHGQHAVLGFRDGECLRYMADLRDLLRRSMLRYRPRSIFTVAYEGGHPDHDACHWAVVRAAQSMVDQPLVYEFPAYHRGGRLFRAGVLLPGEGHVMRTPPNDRDVLLKAAILRSHGVHGSFLRWFLQLFLDRDELAMGESYRLVPSRSYLDPPHEGRLGYELYTRYRFRMFRSMVKICEARG